MAGFLNFSDPTVTPQTPAQIWAGGVAERSARQLSDFYNHVQAVYNEMWTDKDTNPQGVVDRFTALGTGALVAMEAHAAACQYFAGTLPLFSGTTNMLALVATWKVPSDWTLTYNNDGSITATPPVS